LVVLAGRIGVNTGEVVTGTEERLATGDAVNVAARFEQAAAPAEVLIGDPTLALVHGAVAAERVEPLTLKGKSHPVPAYRLVSVLDAPERSHASRFVGRERELRSLAEAWERVLAQAPLVVVFDDIQWGEETFLDLVESSALLSSAPDESTRRVKRSSGRSPHGGGRATCPAPNASAIGSTRSGRRRTDHRSKPAHSSPGELDVSEPPTVARPTQFDLFSAASSRNCL
jgi:hypothetical protein